VTELLNYKTFADTIEEKQIVKYVKRVCDHSAQ